MNNSNRLLAILLKFRQKPPNSLRNFHSFQVLNQHELTEVYENKDFDRSLFFTNLPNKRRGRKVRDKLVHLNVGNLIIECKNKELNHFSGMHYRKFDIIPLASKGWAHRKSKGDYFRILPKEKYSPFLAEEDLPETFEACQVSEQVASQLRKMKITQPTNIQAKAIQKLLSGDNVLMLGECGSGKTLAYVIATIENLLKWKHKVPTRVNSPLAIMVLSSRELAIQVMQLTCNICTDLGLKCQALLDGYKNSLLQSPPKSEVDIVVCTVGAITTHLRNKVYSTKYCKHVVVDDADSFQVEEKLVFLERFFSFTKLNYSGLNAINVTPNSAQVCFVCAVSPSSLKGKLNDLIMLNEMTTVSTTHLHKLLYNVPQEFLRLSHARAAEKLLRTLKANVNSKKPTLIFSNRNKTCNWVSFFLRENDIECPTINKNDRPAQRLQNCRDFEAGLVPALSGTNLLSLGFHFPNIKHVINFEFPKFMTDYIHRCGRLGRIGQSSDCLITNFITRKYEVELVQKIEKAVRCNTELPNIFSPKTYYKNYDD